jgi:hypothetical protein
VEVLRPQYLVQLTFEPVLRARPNDCSTPVSVSRAAARDRPQSLQSRHRGRGGRGAQGQPPQVAKQPRQRPVHLESRPAVKVEACADAAPRTTLGPFGAESINAAWCHDLRP